MAELESRVATLESEVTNLVRSVNRIGESIDKLSIKVSAGGQTNWGVLASFGTLIVIIVATLGTLALLPVRASLETSLGQFREHEQKESHPAADVALKELRRNYDETKVNLRNQDDALQDEMRRINDATKELLDEMNKGLQDEFKLMLATHSKAQEATEKSVDRIMEWTDVHDRRVVGIDAAQWERIRAIERSVFGRVPMTIPFGAIDGSQLEN